jgi:hypothetical protein
MVAKERRELERGKLENPKEKPKLAVAVRKKMENL